MAGTSPAIVGIPEHTLRKDIIEKVDGSMTIGRCARLQKVPGVDL